MNLPDYQFLPAPLWLITVLHLVTLTLHLAAMNFLLGGVMIILFGRFKDKWGNETVKSFVTLFPFAMAATVSFAVAPLLFVQLVYPKQVYSASIVSGWFWLMVILAAIASYYFLYAGAFAPVGSNGRKRLYLLLALLGFAYISFVYSSVFSLAERPDLYRLLYAGNQSGVVINSHVGSYIFRWLHMLLGALTVGSYFVGLLGRDDEQAWGTGKRFFLGGMVGAMVVGLVYLLTLGEALPALMGTPAIWLLVVAVFLSLGSLHQYFKRKFVLSGLGLFLSMLGMVSVRHWVRLVNLRGHYDPASHAISPQWSVFLLFLVCFVIAIVVIWYMLRLFFSGKAAAEQ